MKKVVVIAVALVCIVLIAYLWYARASIYWKLGGTPIFAPQDYTNYTIGAQDGKPIVYVALGDSLTAGVGVDSYKMSYPYLIAQNISETKQAPVELVPLAIPGIRSEYVAGYFLEETIAQSPDIITLFIGTNDIHGNVGTEKFSEHVETILSTLTRETDAEIYVINLPYIGTKDLVAQPYRYYFDLQTQKYNTVLKVLTSKYKVTYLDLYSAHQTHKLDTTYYAPDFFHPNAVGYKLWADYIYANFSK